MNYRSTLQQLAEYGHRQQEELLRRQEQIQRVHDNLMENSKSILAAQVSIFLWTVPFLFIYKSKVVALVFIILTYGISISAFRNLLNQSKQACLLL